MSSTYKIAEVAKRTGFNIASPGAGELQDRRRAAAHLEMVALTAELQQTARVLGRHTPDGPCDDDCGCAAPASSTTSGQSPVQLTTKPVAGAAARAAHPSRPSRSR